MNIRVLSGGLHQRGNVRQSVGKGTTVGYRAVVRSTEKFVMQTWQNFVVIRESE